MCSVGVKLYIWFYLSLIPFLMSLFTLVLFFRSRKYFKYERGVDKWFLSMCLTFHLFLLCVSCLSRSCVCVCGKCLSLTLRTWKSFSYVLKIKMNLYRFFLIKSYFRFFILKIFRRQKIIHLIGSKICGDKGPLFILDITGLVDRGY